MSSVGSLSTSTSTSIRGYGGLASGLDRDELIKGMTLGTTTKINKQEQKKQQIQWMQEAVQTISDKMIGFHGKYTETLTSPTNMFSGALWGRNKINLTGANSSKISVSGASNSGKGVTVMGVKSRAENAKWSSSQSVSSGMMQSGSIDMTDKVYLKEGDTLNILYNGENYEVELGAGDYKTAKGVKDAVNAALANTALKDGGGDLSSVISLDVKSEADNRFSFVFKNSSAEEASLTGGSALNRLGFEAGRVVEASGAESASLTEEILHQTIEQRVGGKSLTFSYNGTEKTVTIDGADKLKEAAEKKLQDGSANDSGTAMKMAIADSLEKQLQSAFGKDRIKVSVEDGKLSFKTTVPGKNGDVDSGSVLTVTGGDAAAELGLKKGMSTRLDLSKPIADRLSSEELEKLELKDTDGNGTGKYEFDINGTKIEFDNNTTVQQLMDTINKSGADVTVSYQESTDRFTFTSTEKAASGVIDFSGNSPEKLDSIGKIFGLSFKDKDGNVEASKRGTDAVFSVKYEDSDEVVELRRDTNTFEVDGLSIELKGRFGYDKDGNLKLDEYGDIDESNAVGVTATVDVDKLVDTIKSFVEGYNEIVDMVNKELTTKHEKDYTPLSSEQKSELSDDEVEKWEEKAKAGLLYGDSDLRSLSMDLRTVATSYVWQLEQVGISVSSTYSDNGKLSVDETKLRAALEKDPGSVEKLFTAKEGVGEDGKPIYDGVATNLKRVMEKYVKTTGDMDHKGILIRKAGSKSSAMSMTENTYYDQLKSIEKLIDSLNDRLKTERDRYIKQFTTLESLIANMNTQSSYLSSMSGY